MMKVQVPMWSTAGDAELQFYREMGVEYISVMFHENDWDYESVSRLQERMAKFDLKITDAGSFSVFKNPIIHLGLDGRDEQIDRYNRFTTVMGQCKIPICSLAWQPDGAVRSYKRVGQYTRGSVSGIVDMTEIEKRELSHGRIYSEEEIWDNFKYFLDRTLPVCEKAGVKMALHPNDPPTACVMGVSSLIYNSEGFKRAFELAGNSPYLGMKLCVGCWLEAGDAFGNLMEDIRYFVELGKVLAVHFRNLSAPMPYFEEVLLEDGYADMYRIMKQLVRYGCDALISVDHVAHGVPEFGGMAGAYGYSTGYMKGLLYAAEREIKWEIQEQRL
ncbi:MAG: mannonate dehydratase [Clostridium sp.]